VPPYRSTWKYQVDDTLLLWQSGLFACYLTWKKVDLLVSLATSSWNIWEIQSDNKETFQRSAQMTPAVVNLPAIRTTFVRNSSFLAPDESWLVRTHRWPGRHRSANKCDMCSTAPHTSLMNGNFFFCVSPEESIGRRRVRWARNGFLFSFSFVIDSLGLCQDRFKFTGLNVNSDEHSDLVVQLVTNLMIFFLKKRTHCIE